jgi:hypothetical protein
MALYEMALYELTSYALTFTETRPGPHPRAAFASPPRVRPEVAPRDPRLMITVRRLYAPR